MEILLWLLPAALVTGCAMLWAGWAGRERPERAHTEADQERFAEAILKPMPQPSRASVKARERHQQRASDPTRRSA